MVCGGKELGGDIKKVSLFVFFAPFHFLAEFPDSADSRRPDPSNPKQLRVKKKEKKLGALIAVF